MEKESLTGSLQQNQEEYGTGEMQRYLLSIMSVIDKFCRENEIEYSLSGGSLLGAIRHKGFIPWDDDIDIMLDRGNYERLVKLSGQLPDDFTIVQKLWVKKITRKDNADIDKEMGCVDLFVFDNVPNNCILRGVKLFLLQTLQGMIKLERDYKKYGIKDKILILGTHILGLPFSQKTKQKWYDYVSKLGNGKNSDLICVYNTYFNYIKSCRFSREVISQYMDVPFENCTFHAICGYDEYLTSQYGDYMKLPSVKDRMPSHRKK